MRVPFGRAFALLVFPCAIVAGQSTHAQQPPARGSQQPPPARGIALATVDPAFLTRIETLLATPDLVLTTDFHRIDMRFGPNVGLDAVVVTAVDSQKRLRGLRIGLREDAKLAPREGWSFLDFEEIAGLSRALASMAEIAGKWSGREDQRSTDVTFTTVGGFGISIHELGHIQKVVLSSGFIDPVRTSVEIIDFPGLKQAVDQALAVLADK
jgi:hypothetical protein